MLSLNANSCRTFLALIEKLMPDGSAIIKLKKQDQLRINRIQEYENTNEGDIELYRFALVPPKGQGSRESIDCSLLTIEPATTRGISPLSPTLSDLRNQTPSP